MSVRVHQTDGVAEVVLDRPAVLNSFDGEMVAEMHRALDQTEGSRAILIRGEGRGFSAGRDLSGAEPLTEDAEAILAETFNPLMARLAEEPLPTIAAVHGACLGVGFGIAMACDIVIAAATTKIGSPFANIGAVLDSGGHYALVHRVGPHRALELIYTGRLLDGHEAAAWGLVNRVVDDDALIDEARQLAARIAADRCSRSPGPSGSCGASSTAPCRWPRCWPPRPRRRASRPGRAEYVEGFTAFAEKRKPDFLG